MNWKEKHIWKYEGKGFCVEVVGHHPDSSKEFAEWNVYLYIYSTHLRFKECKPDMWGCPVYMPGASFYEQHKPLQPHRYIVDKETGISSHQYGNDYNHLWHEGWETSSKKIQAFIDAEKIIDLMECEIPVLSITETPASI